MIKFTLLLFFIPLFGFFPADKNGVDGNFKKEIIPAFLHNYFPQQFFGDTIKDSSSCKGNCLFNENREMKGSSWNVSDHLIFDFNIADTLAKYNFYFNISCTDDYPFSNLYIFFRTKFPNGKMQIDTAEFALSDETGNWYGTTPGKEHQLKLIFRKGIKFPFTGKYHMEMEQAMRMTDLPGINTVGLRIEKAEMK
jgi:gliding motility-associated lipoprotein GldH